MRMHTPALMRQRNGTDCGIFTLLYQQTVSNWYGTAAGQTFNDTRIQELINSLRTINQDTADRHREWVRINMHTWWRGNWEGAATVTPPGTHQRQVQKRRHRRRVQETCMVEYQTTEPSATQAADRDTTKLEQESCTSVTAKGTPSRKRSVQQIEAEEQADRAATEIVDLVEQDAQRSAGSLTGSSTPSAMYQPPSMATGAVERAAGTEQEEGVMIPEWVITESREMNREVTPPAHLFFRDQGEWQDGDCGPAAVIGTLYYIYCKAGVTRVALETLLAYRAIRRFAAAHLQQQTLLKVAQVDDTQMVGCQSEV